MVPVTVYVSTWHMQQVRGGRYAITLVNGAQKNIGRRGARGWQGALRYGE